MAGILYVTEFQHKLLCEHSWISDEVHNSRHLFKVSLNLSVWISCWWKPLIFTTFCMSEKFQTPCSWYYSNKTPPFQIPAYRHANIKSVLLYSQTHMSKMFICQQRQRHNPAKDYCCWSLHFTPEVGTVPSLPTHWSKVTQSHSYSLLWLYPACPITWGLPGSCWPLADFGYCLWTCPGLAEWQKQVGVGCRVSLDDLWVLPSHPTHVSPAHHAHPLPFALNDPPALMPHPLNHVNLFLSRHV